MTWSFIFNTNRWLMQSIAAIIATLTFTQLSELTFLSWFYWKHLFIICIGFSSCSYSCCTSGIASSRSQACCASYVYTWYSSNSTSTAFYGSSSLWWIVFPALAFAACAAAGIATYCCCNKNNRRRRTGQSVVVVGPSKLLVQTSTYPS